MAENENMRDTLLDADIDAAPPPRPAPPPPTPTPTPASPATADGLYVARHQKGGWRVRTQQQNWAALQMMRDRALTLRTIIMDQYRGRGRGRGWGRGQERGRGRGRGGGQK